MDVINLLNLALGVVSVATLAGLGLLRGTVINLREQLRDERDRSASLVQQRTEDRSKIDQLTGDLSALGRVVTAETHWVSVGEQLDEHHDDAQAHWVMERALLTEVRDILRSQGHA